MAEEANPSGQQPPEGKPDAFVNFWLDQLDAAKQEFKDWETRCKKIKRRYRDERSETQDGAATPGFRFNALWSNIQTLMPAVYINPPKPVAERRFLDKDTLARYASMTLERSLSVQIEVGYLHTSTQKAVLDWLLYGRGVVWERYEPKYGEPMDLGETEESEKPADPGAKGETEAVRPVTYEKVCTDYVAHDKFRHSPASIWDDVWWVAKEEMLTRRQLRERFKGEYQGKKIADLIPLQSADKDKEKDPNKGKKLPRACIWEIWDKSRRQVIFIAPDWPNAVVEKADDPLGLECFWPCPEPLYATLTNDTLVPVPDFVEYQDQADELDNLTARIKALTDAVRVNGVYDSSIPELMRILSEGADNRLIGVKNWAELQSKGGVAKAIDFVPFKEVVEALLGLYDARDRVKADMAEITGLSDIIRGQAQGQAKTATEQRIKGQFASLRLEDRKKAVARFCRDTIRIAGEIISEQFEPKLLAEMTGMVPFIATELEDDMQGAAQQQPGMGHNGGPPMQSPPLAPAGVSPPQAVGAPGGMPPAAGMQPPQPPDVNALAEQKFMEACQLLKSDKMRTFRIDIETDSTIEVDKQEAKDSVVELFTALGGMLEKALPAGQMMPELVPALGQSLLFAFRRFGAGRDVEGAWENAVDQMVRKAKNPPPPQPSPEQVKAEADQKKAELDAQTMQQKAALDAQAKQQDMALQQQKAQLEIQKQQMELQFKERELQMKERELNMQAAAKQQQVAIEAQATQQKAALEAEGMEREAAFDERAAERDEQRAVREDEFAERSMEREQQAGEEKFKLDQKVAKAKAAQAVKPKEREKA